LDTAIISAAWQALPHSMCRRMAVITYISNIFYVYNKYITTNVICIVNHILFVTLTNVEK